MYFTIFKSEYYPKIFVIPEKNQSIKKIKLRKEIINDKEKCVEILDEFLEENLDLDDNKNLSLETLQKIAKKIEEKTDQNLVQLFIARKVIKYVHRESQEMKYRKF